MEDSPIEIKEKLESLVGDSRLDASAIKGLSVVLIGTESKRRTNSSSSGVETDPVWTAEKGDYSTKAQADLLYAPIGSGGVTTATINLSSADILGLFTTPKQLVATPGANKIIIPTSIYLSVTRTSTAFTGGGNVAVRYTDGSGPMAHISAIDASYITGSAGTAVMIPQIAIGVDGVEYATTDFINQPIVLTNDTGVFADGTGTAEVTISYYVIDV